MPSPRSSDAPSGAVRREYADQAAAYDRRWAAYVKRSLALLRPYVEGAALGDVLDVGCGTGSLLPRLHAWGARVSRYVGADLAPQMLAVAREKLAGVVHPVSLIAGAAEALPLRPASFDTAVSASSLHDWPEPAAALADVRRLLRPGGRLLLLDWSRDPLPMRLLNAAMRLRGIGYERMYARAEVRQMLRGAGFRVARESGGSAGGPWRLAAFEAVADGG